MNTTATETPPTTAPGVIIARLAAALALKPGDHAVRLRALACVGRLDDEGRLFLEAHLGAETWAFVLGERDALVAPPAVACGLDVDRFAAAVELAPRNGPLREILALARRRQLAARAHASIAESVGPAAWAFVTGAVDELPDVPRQPAPPPRSTVPWVLGEGRLGDVHFGR